MREYSAESELMEENKMHESFKQLHWWRKDSLGWPIETFKGRPISSFIRIVCQNIRKVLAVKKIWALIWLLTGLYFVVAAIGKGAGATAAIAMVCGFMVARNVADIVAP